MVKVEVSTADALCLMIFLLCLCMLSVVFLIKVGTLRALLILQSLRTGDYEEEPDKRRETSGEWGGCVHCPFE